MTKKTMSVTANDNKEKGFTVMNTQNRFHKNYQEGYYAFEDGDKTIECFFTIDEETKKDGMIYPVFIAEPDDEPYFFVIDAQYVESQGSLNSIVVDSIEILDRKQNEEELLAEIGVRYVEKEDAYADDKQDYTKGFEK